MSTGDPRADLVDAVVQRVEARMDADEAVRAARFVRRFFEGVGADDITDSPVDNLYGRALGMWRFAARRAPRSAAVRVFNPRYDEHGWRSTRTAVEIVNDDMPFLVDSVRADLNRMNLTVHRLVHPTVRIVRDDDGVQIAIPGADDESSAVAESCLQILVSRQTDKRMLEEIRVSLEGVLTEVRAAVEDWQPILARLGDVIAEIAARPPPLPRDTLAEDKAFLEWIRNHSYIFLGARTYQLVSEKGKTYQRPIPGTGLGVFRDLSPPARAFAETPLSRENARFLRRKELLINTKADTRSKVHRSVHMDYLGVRLFDRRGKVTGEQRFVGLFTASAYNRSPREIPLLRRKMENVLARFPLRPTSHSGKALLNILETYPRDELFQISEDLLAEFATGILQLEQRQRLRLFMRTDNYAQSIFCLVYVPRDRFDTQLRKRLETILLDAFNGTAIEFGTQLTNAPMARLQFIVRVAPGTEMAFDGDAIEARLAAASRDWTDDLYDALIDNFGEGTGDTYHRRYSASFPTAYRDSFSAKTAAHDIGHIESLSDTKSLAISLYRRIEAADDLLHFKIFHGRHPVPLSDILPMIENMGLKVLAESPYRIRLDDGSVWIHDFTLRSRRQRDFDLDAVKELFEEAFIRVWTGEVEDDAFNELVLGAGLKWREVVVLRAYDKFLRQAGGTFSQEYVAETLATNTELARLLVDLFQARLDPDRRDGVEDRISKICQGIYHGFDAVDDLDHDRILRRFLDLIRNTLRTNYFQSTSAGLAKPYLSFKLDSPGIDELPLPRPMVEIFVYSPRVEGVHLRGGRVARGGLRWSDRREDYRTEVLGLVQAQMVKNAVIVPVGAKGGFVVKRPPADGGREARAEEGIACYRTFISGLLDITDNLVGGSVVPPPRVVRHDGDDPYLVVAADKGTATFSDIANGVAIEYGFWLGDAFASGGSSGYDHKGMGITARGAWESVKRHFRELGLDTQSTEFTAVGIGDMSGDVFGNGMLLSPHILLVGAFNHEHIFVDPNPNARSSFAERKRLFESPRTTWADYDRNRISKGGGIFERRAKSIAISDQIKARFDISNETLTPSELIRAMLRARFDLLWNGGIGTYVKADDETHADVGDRANVATRVNASELRCRVIGEGGNLGLTQRGRIAFALAGGHVCTDAIDNSAGVDCSDHEVNIKILLDGVVAAGDLTVKQRNALLARMTDEVADLALRDNYQQTLALGVAEEIAAETLEPQARMMRRLERARKLDRTIEFLPDDKSLSERQKANIGLTRPELAVLLAYSKMNLYPALLESDLPEDSYLSGEIVRYFPKPLREKFKKRIAEHGLRREIIATVVTNSMVNRVLMTLVDRLVEETGHGASTIARAYTITRDTFGLRELWSAIEGLDNKVPAGAQIAMQIEIMHLIERCTLWFLRNCDHPLDIAATIAAFAPGVRNLARKHDSLVGSERRAAIATAKRNYISQGVPAALAGKIVILDPLASACDIIEAARHIKIPVEDTGKVYFQIGDQLRIDWLRTRAARFASKNEWQRQAVKAIIDDLFVQQRILAGAALSANGGRTANAVKVWIDGNTAPVDRAMLMFDDLKTAEEIDLAMLTVASRQIHVLAKD